MISFDCQKGAFNALHEYAKQDKHSIVVEGSSGSGKTFACKQYARMLDIDDCVIVNSKVFDIKECFDSIVRMENKVLAVVENLDKGVPACAYALLKYMEEPMPNMYIAVTCESAQNIPATILSRSMTACVQPPTYSDLVKYAENASFDSFDKIKRTKLWRSCVSFSDVDSLCSMDLEKVAYISKWSNLKMFSGTVSDICWKMCHFEDGSEIPITLIVSYIMQCNSDNKHVVSSCIRCANDLASGRIAKYLVLTKLAFDLKYCE